MVTPSTSDREGWRDVDFMAGLLAPEDPYAFVPKPREVVGRVRVVESPTGFAWRWQREFDGGLEVDVMLHTHLADVAHVCKSSAAWARLNVAIEAKFGEHDGWPTLMLTTCIGRRLFELAQGDAYKASLFREAVEQECLRERAGMTALPRELVEVLGADHLLTLAYGRGMRAAAWARVPGERSPIDPPEGEDEAEAFHAARAGGTVAERYLANLVDRIAGDLPDVEEGEAASA